MSYLIIALVAWLLTYVVAFYQAYKTEKTQPWIDQGLGLFILTAGAVVSFVVLLMTGLWLDARKQKHDSFTRGNVAPVVVDKHRR